MSKKEPKKGKAPKEAPQTAPKEAGAKKAKPKGPQEPSRLRSRYKKEVVPALMKHFNYKNVMGVPKLERIVINIGLGEAISNAKSHVVSIDELGRVSGQLRAETS